MNIPAARMIGVASRNANRAGVVVVEPADQAGRHHDPVTADPGDQRGGLNDPDRRRPRRYSSVFRAAARRPTFGSLTSGERTDLGAPAHPLGAEQDEAVHDQEDRRDQRLRQWRTRPVCSSKIPRIPVGMLAITISQARRSVGRLDRPPAKAEHPREGDEERLDQIAPSPPEVDQQPDRAADVEHHDEREPRRLGLGLPATMLSTRTGSGTGRCGRGSRSGRAR